MINEILQWVAIIWIIWATHNYGKAINAICDSLKEIAKWEQDRLYKESNKPNVTKKDIQYILNEDDML